MQDSKAMGSLADKLLRFVNTAIDHNVNYEIAVTMLQNYSKLKRMGLGDIADLCFVSKATVSRFFRKLGFESFNEVQDILVQDFKLSADYSNSFLTMLNHSPQNALENYQETVIKNIIAPINEENLKIIQNVVCALHDSSRVAYFSHHFLWDIGSYLQSKIMQMDRYVEQYADYFGQLECARNLNKDDLAIICTIGGSYPARYSNIWNAIVSSGCKLLVITQNLSCSYWNSVEYILPCGEANQNNVGKYGALMVVDLILISYLKKYDTF